MLINQFAMQVQRTAVAIMKKEKNGYESSDENCC